MKFGHIPVSARFNFIDSELGKTYFSSVLCSNKELGEIMLSSKSTGWMLIMGIIAGILPAIRAVAIRPVEAIRTE